MNSLEKEAHDTFCFLSETEFYLGTASIADLEERWEVLRWLTEDSMGGSIADPRGPAPESERAAASDENSPAVDTGSGGQGGGVAPNADWVEFIPYGLRNRWCFTKNDEDSYPSVPHGHLDNKVTAWPKLNPYTGRAYKRKDAEEKSLRLTKREMITLWNDRDFRRHALETIVWYSETHPYYVFPVRNPHRIPRWRRR